MDTRLQRNDGRLIPEPVRWGQEVDFDSLEDNFHMAVNDVGPSKDKVWQRIKAFIVLKYTQRQRILSYNNSTAIHKFLKNLTPWRDSNPGSSVL
jgi:hypothetical protein